MRFVQFTSFVALFLVGCAGVFAAAPTITVDAGKFDRRDTVVSFELPKTMGKLTQAKAADGTTLPIQIDPDGKASMIIRMLPKGARATYSLVRTDTMPAAEVKVVREKTKLRATVGDRTLLEYQAEPGELPREDIRQLLQRGGYIHPIFSPSGKLVTDDFPTNHIHHHGVWWAWTKTDFQGRHPDFWNMGDGKGKVDFVKLDQSWSGPVHGGFTARNQFVDLTAPKPVIALNEVWEVRIYNSVDAGRGWIFDLISTQTCATPDPLKLPEYRYGGVGLRGNKAWNGKENTQFLTSEGEADRDKGNTTHGRWCDMSGLVEGARAGITVLGHPSNFRAPQPMRLHPDEPFFCFAPQQAGDMEIAPGAQYVSRYRFVVHDGAPDKSILDAAWNDFANPPTVTISAD